MCANFSSFSGVLHFDFASSQVQSQLQSLQDQRKSVSSNIEQYDKAAAAIKSPSNDLLTLPLLTYCNRSLTSYFI